MKCPLNSFTPCKKDCAFYISEFSNSSPCSISVIAYCESILVQSVRDRTKEDETKKEKKI